MFIKHKRFFWTLTLFWAMLLEMAFMIFLVQHSAPWLTIKLPLLVMAIAVMGVTVRLLDRHYSVKLSTETVDKSA